VHSRWLGAEARPERPWHDKVTERERERKREREREGGGKRRMRNKEGPETIKVKES